MVLEDFSDETRELIDEVEEEVGWDTFDSALDFNRSARDQREENGVVYRLQNRDDFFLGDFDEVQEEIAFRRDLEENPRVTSRLDIEEDIELLHPTIVRPEGGGDQRIEVQPAYVERFAATTENDNRVHKTLCGESYVEPIGEDEWQITIEGLVTEPQLMRLIEMRPANNELKILANPIEKDYNNVTFDRFTFEYQDDMNRGQFGEDDAHPMAEFQLQTQDDDAPQ